MSDLELVDDRAARRYSLRQGGAEVGFIDYDPIGTQSMLIKHAEVDPAYEGKGFGRRLVAMMLDDVRQRGLTVVPICPYTLQFIRTHREYADLVRADMQRVL
jgi:predicted GNAT family acetyltransferase